MKSCNLLVVSLFLFLINCELRAQCVQTFTVDEIQYDETQLGQIKILIENGGSNQSYLIKAYEINSDVNLIIERNQLSVDNKLSISGLKPSTYWIRIEWEGSCFKTVGGLNGIVVGSKNEQQ